MREMATCISRDITIKMVRCIILTIYPSPLTSSCPGVRNPCHHTHHISMSCYWWLLALVFVTVFCMKF